MKIIDRKALVAALIMACGNGVCANSSEDLTLTTGCVGGGAGVGASVVAADKDPKFPVFGQNPYGSPEAQTAVLGISGDVANGDEKQRLIESMLADMPQLMPLLSKLKTLHLEAFKKFQSMFDEWYVEAGDPEEIIRLLEPLNATQIEAIGLHASKLFTRDMSVYNNIHIISAFDGVEASEIASRAEAIYTHVSKLFTRNMDRYDKAGIIRAFAGVEAYAIESRVMAIYSHVNKIFTRDMEGNHKAKIIRAFADVEASEVESRVKSIYSHVKTLFITRDMDAYKKADIICAFFGVGASEIESRAMAISLHVRALFHGMHQNVQAEIISAFAGVPASKIASRAETIYTHVSKLFTHDMNEHGKAVIINAFSGVEASEIALRVEAINTHISAPFHVDTIPYLAPLSVAQIQDLATRLTLKMDWRNRLEFMESFHKELKAVLNVGASGATSGTVGR